MSNQSVKPAAYKPPHETPLQSVLRPLTAREREVLLGILDGESVKETARRLRVSPKTIEFHRRHTFEKTGLRTATETLLRLGRWRNVTVSEEVAVYGSPGRRGADAAVGSVAEGSDIPINLISGGRYSRQVDPSLITIMMVWDSAGEATGYLMLPTSIRYLVEERNYPPASEPMPIESAMAYGLFLSLKSSVPMCLAGDATVWNESWGRLTGAATGLVAA